MKTNPRVVARLRRHRRVRKQIRGTATRPRLSVYRSLHHIYAQVIDDDAGHTLAAASTLDSTLRQQTSEGSKQEAAAAVGKLVAERALAAGITEVVFDRGGYPYHGRVKALAEASRAAGLQF